MSYQPESFLLVRLGWQFFGSLTFKGQWESSTRLRKRTFALFRRTAENFRVHFPRLLWVLRGENGERFGRAHLHFLVGGLPKRSVSVSTCFGMMHFWEHLGGGMARIFTYDARLNGVGYVAECLGDSEGLIYEGSKFSRPDTLTLSASCYRVLRHGQMMTDRAIERYVRTSPGGDMLRAGSSASCSDGPGVGAPTP